MTSIDFKHMQVAARRQARAPQGRGETERGRQFGAALERRIESARRAARNVTFSRRSRTGSQVPKT